jgi:hypothetical protein
VATLHEILDELWPGHGCSTAEQPDGSYLITSWSENAPRPQPTEEEVLSFSGQVDLILYRRRLVVSPVQLRLALSAAGLRTASEALVDAATPDVKDYWEYSVAYHRDHPLIVQFGAALGKTPEEIDAIFEAAALIGD